MAGKSSSNELSIAGSSVACARALAGVALAVGLASNVWAQTAPGAGQLLQDAAPRVQPGRPSAAPRLLPAEGSRPAARAESAVKFRLEAVRFSGNSVFSDEVLGNFFAQRIGKEVSLTDLQTVVEAISEHYRARGYFLAQALIPAQEIVGGRVEVSVVEGTLGKLRIERTEGLEIDDDVIRGFLAGLQPGKPLNERDVERAMLLLSDLPGGRFRSAIEEGETPGTVDLIIETAPGRRFAGQAEVDNHGMRSSGEQRLGAGMRVASPSGIGDNLDLRLQLTSAARTLFGRVGYERPLGFTGTRLGFGYSQLGYALGPPFAELGAEGYARVFDVTMLRPLLRSRGATLVGTLQLQRKWVSDRYTGLTPELEFQRDISSLVSSLAYDVRDQWLGGGFSSLSVSLALGNVGIANETARSSDSATDSGRGTRGSFAKLNFSANRLQSLSGPWLLFAGLSGQVASRNLDNAERFGLGGPRAVRAFAPGAVVGDEGLLGSVELRYSVTPEVTLSAFYDAGWARINHDPMASVPDNTRSLRGGGLGLYWGRAASFQFQGSVAWRNGGAPQGDAQPRVPAVYGQMVKFF